MRAGRTLIVAAAGAAGTGVCLGCIRLDGSHGHDQLLAGIARQATIRAQRSLMVQRPASFCSSVPRSASPPRSWAVLASFKAFPLEVGDMAAPWHNPPSHYNLTSAIWQAGVEADPGLPQSPDFPMFAPQAQTDFSQILPLDGNSMHGQNTGSLASSYYA